MIFTDVVLFAQKEYDDQNHLSHPVTNCKKRIEPTGRLWEWNAKDFRMSVRRHQNQLKLRSEMSHHGVLSLCFVVTMYDLGWYR